MKKPKSEKRKDSIKKPPVPPNRKKTPASDKVEELFGVHIISEADIENHFGTPEKTQRGKSENKKHE